jgi:alpha-glucosidase
MRSLTRTLGALLFFVATFPLAAQWTDLGDMPPPVRQGSSLRFANARAAAVVTVLSPDVIRVRVSPGLEGRDHSYAVVNRNLGDAAASVSSDATHSTITTATLRVAIQHAPFRIAFATRDGGVSLDEDDPRRGTAISGSEVRVWKRLRDDEHVYGLGEKGGPLDKRGSKLGGYSVTNWNSDTFGYDASTDPLYVSVPFYIDLRKGVAYGVFLDNTWRSNFDIGHQTQGVLSFGADGGALDYYFIYGPEPKKVIERYTALTGRMPLPPLWSLGYHQCRYSYYPESRVRFIAENFRERHIPADVIWLDIHYQDRYRPFTWNRERFPDPARMIGDLRKEGFRLVTIVDPHPPKVPGYAPYDSGLAGDQFVKNPDGSIYEAPVWPSKAEDGDSPDWSRKPGTSSVFPDFTKPAARAWWGGLYADFAKAGVSGIWNDMNEPAVFDTPTGTMPLDVRHDNEGAPADHREIHNVYGMLMSRATYEGLVKLRPNVRPFVLSRASFAGGQRYTALWPGDNTSNWAHLRQSVPTLMGMGLSGFPFVGSDIGGFIGAPSAELYTRWLQAGVFYPFMRTHTMFGSPDQEPWSYGTAHEALNRRAIELRYELLPEIYNVMQEAAENGVPAMRPLLLEYPADEGTYGTDDEFLFGSDLLAAPVLEEGASDRGVYLPAGDWYDYWSGAHYSGGKGIGVPVTMASIPLFVRGGAFVFTQPVIQHTGEMPGQALEVMLFPAASSERSLYEDDGNSFDYQHGAFLRRTFTQHRDSSTITIDVSAPEGSYHPKGRPIVLIARGQGDAAQVTIQSGSAAAVPLPRQNTADFAHAERGWSVEDGSVRIKFPDPFEATHVRIENAAH